MTIRWAQLVAFSLILAIGCSDDPTAPNAPDQTQSPAITLEAPSAAPFARLEVSGLGAYDPALFAQVLDSDNQVLAPAPLQPGPADEILLTIPPHPQTPLAGGTLFVRVTDGAKLTSQVATLEVEALPSHPGALARMTAALQATLDAQLTTNETTREALRTTSPDQLRPEDSGLFAVQSFLDDPANPNSLLALTAGPIPYFANSDLDRDLVDSMIGSTGFDVMIEEIAAGLQQEADKLRSSRSKDLTITNMTELSDAMDNAALFDNLISDNSGQVLNDLGVALGVVGVFSGGSTAVAGAGLWALQKTLEVGGSLLPSMFDNGATTVELSPTDFFEDDPGPGAWTNFTVVAKSRGMSLDTLILEGILQYAGLGTSFGDFIESFGGDIAQEMAGFVITEATNAVIGAAGDGSGIITIDPRSWTVTSTGDPLTQGRIVQGPAVDTVAPNGYVPVEVGVSNMWIETLPGNFGGQVAFKPNSVEVKAIEVEVLPGGVNVEPGEVVDFTAVVRNAMDEELQWTTTGGTLTQTSNTSASLQTPVEAWDEPIVVKATSRASGGLRQSGEPERSGQALVATRNGQIIIEPFGVCVEPDQTQVFTSVILDFPPEQQAVTWSAQRGTFTGSTYRAPSSIGGDTVTATSVSDPSLSASVGVSVSACTCYWSAQVSGADSGAFTGSKAQFDHIAGVLTTVTCDPAVSNVSPPNFFMQVFPSLDAGQIGSFEALLQYSSPSGLVFVQSPESVPMLTVTKNEDDILEGSISGQLFTVDPNNVENLLSVTVSVSFRAALGFGSGGDGCPLQ